MLTRWLTVFSFVSFCLLSLTVLQVTKRPLCIDSRVVERIDRLNSRGTEVLYRCGSNRTTAFSAYFHQNMKDFTYRIAQIERLLESIEPFYRKSQVTILSDRPYLFRVQGHQIFIGEKLMEAPGHIEKALAKVWYRERNENLFAQQDLMEEVVTDFLVYLVGGDVDIGDPETRIKTALRNSKWPYVIKSVGAYCDSPWKASEHFVACQDKNEAVGNIGGDVVEMSLRPLLVNSWIKSYRDLSGADRFDFVQSLPVLLRSEHVPPLPITTALPASGVPETAILKAAEAVKNVNAFFSSSRATKKSPVHRLFVASFTNELQATGFQDAFAEASFDILYVSKEKLKTDDKIFGHFMKLSKTNQKMQIALRDSENLWMLPSRYPLPLKSFGQIKANRTVVEKCGGYNFSYVIDHADKTEKLLVVDHCDLKKEVYYARYLKEGAEGFGAENRGVAFVQFHLPSLLMKKNELQSVANVFEFIQKRDVENPSFRSLGWTEVHWSELAHAYQPKAFVDAIEWFRIPN